MRQEAKLEYENVIHYYVDPESECPDYLDWECESIGNFVYGYFNPDSRIRIRLLMPDEPVEAINVANAVIETKVFLSADGIRRAKTVSEVTTVQALCMFAVSERVVEKTFRTFLRPEGRWSLGFKLGTWELVSAELEPSEYRYYDPVNIPRPNFVIEPFALLGTNREYTYRYLGYPNHHSADSTSFSTTASRQ